MGYRTDQFYRLGRAGEPVAGAGSSVPGSVDGGRTGADMVADNPAFIYPDRTIRTERDGNNRSKLLRRGYMRSLRTEVEGVDVPLRKCQFQFNPQVLDQSVRMNESVLNFYNQDPAQMTRPMGSEVNFGFEMFFDRSMELNNPIGSGGGFDTDLGYPWEKGDPSEVGVLRDVSTLYSVIGQGVSSDQEEFARAYYSQEAEIDYNLALAADAETDADLAQAQGRIGDLYASGEGGVSINAGNTALLMPLPIRIVFSSLYIVEGFVDSTRVVYTKFNSAMVPMQATVSVMVKALYIGFAKKNTFTTWSLSQAAEASRAAAAEAAADAEDAVKAVLSDLSRIDVALTNNSNGGSYPLSGILQGTDGNSIRSWSKPLTASGFVLATIRENGSMQEFLDTVDGSAVSILTKVKIFGPYSSSSAIGSDGYPKSTGGPSEATEPLVSWNMSAGGIASEEWKELGAAGAGYPSRLGGQSGTITASELPVTFDTTGKWFSVVYEVTASISTGGRTVRGTGSSSVTIQQGTPAYTDDGLQTTLSLAWSNTDAITGLFLPSTAETGNEPGTVTPVGDGS